MTMVKMISPDAAVNPEFAACPSCADKSKRYFCPACNGTRIARCYRCQDKVPFGVWVFRGRVNKTRVFVCRECSIATGLEVAPDIRLVR
jgi:hypothetical protein